ncbi:MAG: aminoacyl-tRNA hydrolase [Candidatus Latescibacterota bacterium]|nr:MAG: aminoacyl-tRNA hydrolase [Candidatus Latescibacterota bacterium]
MEGSVLVVGLGNPGEEYEGTRHNLGFRVLDSLYEGDWEEEELYMYAEQELEGAGVVLLKPLTYMNLSGLAVKEASERWDVPPERILVVSDDVDLPLGRLRMRLKGGPGGHKGLASVVDALGTEGFPRLRLGIGRPREGDLVSYVLSPFGEEELREVEDMVERAAEAVRKFLGEGPEAAMTWANTRQDEPK